MKSFGICFLVGLLCLSGGTAGAVTITQTQSWGLGTPTMFRTVTFDQFDPSLGTLLSVDVEFGITSAGGSLTVDNDSENSANVTVQFGADGTLSSGDVTLLDGGFNPVVGVLEALSSGTYNLSGNVGDGPGDYDSTSPDGTILLGGNVSDSDAGLINPMFFDGYTGPGTFDVDAEITRFLDYGSVGGVEGAFTPSQSDGYVEVVYNYEGIPTPEPGTLALLGLGLAGLCLRRRG